MMITLSCVRLRVTDSRLTLSSRHFKYTVYPGRLARSYSSVTNLSLSLRRRPSTLPARRLGRSAATGRSARIALTPVSGVIAVCAKLTVRSRTAARSAPRPDGTVEDSEPDARPGTGHQLATPVCVDVCGHLSLRA